VKSAKIVLAVIVILCIGMSAFSQASGGTVIPPIAKGGVSYKFVDLGGLYGTDATRAVGVNNAGEVVVNSWARDGSPRCTTVVRMWIGRPFVSRKLAPVAGMTNSYANDINASGVVVGNSTNYSTGGHATVATLWTATGNPVVLAKTQSDAMCVNDRGQVVVWAESGSYVLDTVTRRTARLQNFGDSVWGFAINGRGQVAGVTALMGEYGPKFYPTTWSSYGFVTLIGDETGQMTGLNNAGIGCGLVNTDLSPMPVVWFGQYSFPLFIPQGYEGGSAEAISNAGTAVGSVNNETGDSRACFWGITFGFFPAPSGMNSYATGVNDGGMVIGDVFTDGPDTSHAVAWVPTGRK